MKPTKVHLGSVSCATMLPADLIPAFTAELRRLRGAMPREVANDLRGFNAGNMSEETASEFVGELFDALDNFAPDYCYFGAHPDDGADYGFWLSEDWQQQARDDGVLFVNDLSEVSDSFRGLLCVVNDHGNVTLYSRTGGKVGTLREIWSVV